MQTRISEAPSIWDMPPAASQMAFAVRGPSSTTTSSSASSCGKSCECNSKGSCDCNGECGCSACPSLDSSRPDGNLWSSFPDSSQIGDMWSPGGPGRLPGPRDPWGLCCVGCCYRGYTCLDAPMEVCGVARRGNFVLDPFNLQWMECGSPCRWSRADCPPGLRATIKSAERICCASPEARTSRRCRDALDQVDFGKLTYILRGEDISNCPPVNCLWYKASGNGGSTGTGDGDGGQDSGSGQEDLGPCQRVGGDVDLALVQFIPYFIPPVLISFAPPDTPSLWLSLVMMLNQSANPHPGIPMRESDGIPHGVVPPVSNENNISAGSQRPFNYDPSWEKRMNYYDELIWLREFRGFVYMRPQICCTGDRILEADEGKCVPNLVWDSGWTPNPILAPFATRRVSPPNALWYERSDTIGPYIYHNESFKITNDRGSDCMVWRVKARSRLGAVANLFQHCVWSGLWAPFIWSDIDFAVCCDGETFMDVSASMFPEATVFVKGNPGAVNHVMAANYWGDVRRFTMSGSVSSSDIAMAPPGGKWTSRWWGAGK